MTNKTRQGQAQKIRNLSVSHITSSALGSVQTHQSINSNLYVRGILWNLTDKNLLRVESYAY